MEFWIHLCQYADGFKEARYYWLRVKDDSSIVKVDDYPLSASYLDRYLNTGGVCLNRSLYVLGHAEAKIGVDNWVKSVSKQIYRLDTNNFGKGWEKVGAELTKERGQPHIAQLDGKLYIFESRNFGRPPIKNQPLEVYDPVKETIKLVPQEIVDTSDYVLLGVDQDCKRIVFRAHLSVNLAFYYPYNEDGNKWVVKEIDMDVFHTVFGLWHLRFSITGKTLYWVDGNHHLGAYNLEYDMLSVPVYLGFITNYTSVMSSAYHPEFTHVGTLSQLYHMKGERFCFIWWRGGSYNKIFCTFLNIANAFVDGRFVLVVSELSTRTYSIPPLCGIRTITPVKSFNLSV